MAERIVIDTNVLVAALRSSRGASHRLLLAVGKADFEIVLSVPLVVEYEDAAKRDAEATGLTGADVDDVIDYLCSVAHRQEIYFLWRPILRDPRDDHVLELAVDAGASVIVTHNVKDFAGVESFGIQVLTPRQYLARIGGTK
jgi:putative PIN family toxin of toxin-antitoxin system